jgi:hypothetical protein
MAWEVPSTTVERTLGSFHLRVYVGVTPSEGTKMHCYTSRDMEGPHSSS